MENKREKFVRIAESRTNKIIGTIRLLGNLSNKSNYDYSEDDIKQIFNSIENELKNTRAKFSGSSNCDKVFKLK